MVRANDYHWCRCIRFRLTTPLNTARNAVSGRVALQGNLDPAVLYGSAASIEKAVKAMLDDAYVNGEKQVTLLT